MHRQPAALPPVLAGQLYNRAALAGLLGLPPAAPPDQLLRAGWQCWRRHLPTRLQGDYAVILPCGDETLLIRDPLGTHPLYYRIEARRLFAAFTLPALFNQLSAPPQRDEAWLARYLVGQSASLTATAYHGIQKLAAGHALWFRPGQPPQIWRYHQWQDDAPDARQREPRHAQAYRAALQQAVRHRLPQPKAALAAEYSGGVDSGAVTAVLADLLGGDAGALQSFSLALHDGEGALIRSSARAMSLRPPRVFDQMLSASDRDAEMPGLLTILGMPEEHPIGSGHLMIYRACQELGLRHLFSGFGGDEVVSNNSLIYQQELLDKACYATLWRSLPGDPVRRALRFARVLALGNRGSASLSALAQAQARARSHQVLRPEVAQELAPPPAALPPPRSLNALVLTRALTNPQLVTRLEVCSLIAGAHGVSYRWPLLDPALIQLWLSTPVIEKFGPDGMGRYLHRRAMAGLVPDAVIWKAGKSMGRLIAPPRRRLIDEATVARHHLAHLHPVLAALIDLPKLQTQIDRAMSGGAGQADPAFAPAFRRNVMALGWANHWLHQPPA